MDEKILEYWKSGTMEHWENREEKWMNLSYSWFECSLPIIPNIPISHHSGCISEFCHFVSI